MRPLRAADAVSEPASPLRDAPRTGRTLRFARGPIDEVRAALGMLTRLPVQGSPDARTGARAFAIVGGLLGLAASVPLLALGTTVPIVSAILAVAVLASLSGGLHLDGLADTFDALVALGPDAAERTRQDPAVGAAGATALMVILGLDVAALAELLAARGVAVAGFACVVAGVVSRVVPVLLARIDARAVSGAGLGDWFVRRTSLVDGIVAVLTGLTIVVGSALVIGQPLLAIAGGVAGAGSVGLGMSLVRLRGRLDGDGLGASVELAVATTLVVMTVVVAGLPG
jgi:adenosylcobinamide-GDP ribazoletransferase